MKDLRVKIVDAILAASMACSLLAIGAFGNPLVDLGSQNNVAKRFDQYGDLDTDDEAARLDAFAEELRLHPNLRGYVVGYDGPRKLRGSYLRRIYGDQHYLSWARGIEAKRVVVVDGGYKDEYRIELWLVYEGASPPSPEPTISRSQVNTAKPYKFDVECLDCAPAVNLDLNGVQKEGLKFYAEELRINQNLRGIIVVGTSKTLNEARRAKRILISHYGVEASRIAIRVIHGVDISHVEMWLTLRRSRSSTATSNKALQLTAR